jgi:hypothetical protein
MVDNSTSASVGPKGEYTSCFATALPAPSRRYATWSLSSTSVVFDW